jgi:hypothetical protein
MKVTRITLFVAALSAVCPAVAAAKTHVYALVVAQNRSLDPGVKPLRYADDDGVKDWELLSLYAEKSSLFVLLDDETARMHPDASQMAEVPRKQAIFDRLAEYNALMAQDVARGDDPELFFVYAGHGDVDAAGQGYVNLFDGKLTRGELFHDVVAPSKAHFVHVIIDACKSYFMVNSRGGNKRWLDDQVPASEDRSDQQLKAFFAEEDLSNYPRAGVIVATSGDQDTHEWARYQSGILSHELRSALSGAADVNGDGRIEYSELRAFLAAANARVRNPEARIEAFARPPALDRHHALVDLRNATGNTRFLHFAPGLAGRFHIEDDRGVRWADLNKEMGGGFDVMVSPRHGYYVMRGDSRSEDETEETEFRASGSRRVELSSLKWRPRAIASRGALDQTFRQDLYKVPYGRGFYDGFVAQTGDLPVDGDPAPFLVEEPRARRDHSLSAGYLVSGAPLYVPGAVHAVDARYQYRAARWLDVGFAAQIGGGSSGAESVTRVALLGALAGEWRPVPALGLRLDVAAGWQYAGGTVDAHTTPGKVVLVNGSDPKGGRFEVAAGLVFDIAPSFGLMARGGLAIDVSTIQNFQDTAASLSPLLNISAIIRL